MTKIAPGIKTLRGIENPAMTNLTKQSTPRKRGRKSVEEIVRQVAHALKHMQELELLEESPLGKLGLVRELAVSEYRRTIFPVGFALRWLLSDAVDAVLHDLEQMPNYDRERKFLQGIVQGESVSQISRILGLSREHATRTIQPRALSLVARAFVITAGRPGLLSNEIGSTRQYGPAVSPDDVSTAQ